jgi:[acyl-carrier-protein] S-malonyltransferase
VSSNVAWLFPGQGSQQVGMGKALAERYASAARVFDEAAAALGEDLRRLCWEGPQAELDLTANAQPAILTTSIAALRAAEDELGRELPAPLAVAGHSLGEYSALVAAGAVSLPEGVRLVRRRGELMQAADPSGGMLAVIGLEAAAIASAIADTGMVIANDNAPGQVVVSGPLAAVDAAATRLKAAGAKRVLPLRVSAAFHSSAMRAVAPDLALAIANVAWRPLRYPLVANVDGDVHADVSDTPSLLERQVWSPVRWVDVIRRMSAMGAKTFVELGPGSVLTGLVKRIVPEAAATSLSGPEDVVTALRLIGA